MKPSEHIALLETQLAEARKRIGYLTQLVETGGLDTFEMPTELATKLTAGEFALMSALIDAYPRAMSAYALDEVIPKRDRAGERDTKIVAVLASKVRGKLGKDVIENVWGKGWRCSPAFKDRLNSEGCA